MSGDAAREELLRSPKKDGDSLFSGLFHALVGDTRLEPGEARLEPGEARLEPGEARLEPAEALFEPADTGEALFEPVLGLVFLGGVDSPISYRAGSMSSKYGSLSSSRERPFIMSANEFLAAFLTSVAADLRVCPFRGNRPIPISSSATSSAPTSSISLTIWIASSTGIPSGYS